MELKLTLKDYDRLVSRLEDGTGGNKIAVKKEILNNLIDERSKSTKLNNVV